MSVWKLVRLHFQASVHFGELGIGIEETGERVRSDTLFSAWITAYARLFGTQAVENLLQCFIEQPNNPPFRLSSTFIYLQIGDKIIYYLPKPLRFPDNYPAGDGDLEFFKTYKKLGYLPLEIWQRWYQGEGFTKSDRAELIAKTKKEPLAELASAGVFSYGDTFKTEQIPKIAVDRVTAATNLYHTGFVQFERDRQKQSSLYFLIQFPEANETLTNNLKAALYFLGEEGLGGERSSGAGHFQPEWDNLSPNWRNMVDFPNSNYHSLISLFWQSPLPEGMLTDSSYEIIERGGWISSSPSGRQLRRKMVRMFAEGSVFPKQPAGKLVDVTPDGFNAHKIYRNGISLSLPIKLGEETRFLEPTLKETGFLRETEFLEPTP